VSDLRVSEPRQADLPAPIAPRLARARWLDPRLLIGVVLVLLSVALGARIVAAADNTISVWAVTSDLAPGITVTAGDLRPVAVQLENAGDYLRATSAPLGYQVVREVGDGELLPKDALVEPGTQDLRTVVIEVDRGTTDGLARGRLVDVYAVDRPKTAGDPLPPPRLVRAAVTVAKVADASGALGASGSSRPVSLLVDEASVPDMLAAVSGGDVYLVQRPTASDRRTAAHS
jgi:hypothetical protein